MIDEAGLYVLLNQAAQWEQSRLSAEAVQVTPGELLARPEAYRGRLVKLHARYAECRPFRPENRRRYNAQAYSTLAVDRDRLEPLGFVTVDPPGSIAPMTPVLLAGYFFKLRRDERRRSDPNAGPAEVVVPVLVGRAIEVQRPAGRSATPTGVSGTAIILGVIFLAGMWILLRVRINRGRAGTWRDSARPQKAAASDPSAPENQPIDLEALERGEATASEGPPRTPDRTCGRCGVANRTGARYCDHCGAPLGP